MTSETHFQMLALDPGGRTGWAHFTVNMRAFSRPENKVLAHVTDWASGTLSGTEHQQLNRIVQSIKHSLSPALPTNYLVTHVVSEDFDLTQTVGGRNLLSPVRINAALDWWCANESIKFVHQARQMRTAVTKERLALMGYRKRWGKDEFSAMQHAITYLKRLKSESRERPWKLPDGGILNGRWDCACEDSRSPCDLIHPK